MPLLGGLFGKGEAEHPNLDHIAQSLHDHLGLQLAVPSEDVLAVIDQMIHRELLNFDNLHSVGGMQELFRAKSLRATVDPGTQTVVLELAPAQELEQEIKAEHTQRPVLHVGEHHAKIHVTPQVAAEPIMAGLGKPAEPAQPVAPLPPGFEHIEGLEQLCTQIVDLFIKFGRLNTGDKDVLKNIKPSSTSLEARITALERWQAEVTRRVRALTVPKATQHLTLGGVVHQEKPDEALRHRFDALLVWFSKLIKVFEHTGGVKFHAKPMWLPH
jgi:hypothetical protein